MDPDAVLGPLDPQINLGNRSYPAPSVLRAVKEKGTNVEDTTLVLADIAEKSLKEMQRLIVRLLSDKLGIEKSWELARKLTEGEWTHDYPLTFEEAKELGLPVSCEIPKEVYDLMSLYPQAVQQRPGIEYIPYPSIPPSRRIPREAREE